MAAEIHVGDAGTLIQVHLVDGVTPVLDLNLATTLEMIFRLPDRTLLTVNAAAGATPGDVEYTSLAGTFSVKGEWKLQIHLVVPGSPEGGWHSDIAVFTVHDNLPL